MLAKIGPADYVTAMPIAGSPVLLPTAYSPVIGVAAEQPKGASVALRKLVEDARRANPGAEQRRQAQEATYCFMSAMAGDEAGFEDASCALFAADQEAFTQAQSSWPQDIRHHVQQLAAPVFAAS